MKIDILMGYVELNCSVRCYSKLINFIRKHHIKKISKYDIEILKAEDDKVGKELINFIEQIPTYA